MSDAIFLVSSGAFIILITVMAYRVVSWVSDTHKRVGLLQQRVADLTKLTLVQHTGAIGDEDTVDQIYVLRVDEKGVTVPSWLLGRPPEPISSGVVAAYPTLYNDEVVLLDDSDMSESWSDHRVYVLECDEKGNLTMLRSFLDLFGYGECLHIAVRVNDDALTVHPDFRFTAEITERGKAIFPATFTDIPAPQAAG